MKISLAPASTAISGSSSAHCMRGEKEQHHAGQGGHRTVGMSHHQSFSTGTLPNTRAFILRSRSRFSCCRSRTLRKASSIRSRETCWLLLLLILFLLVGLLGLFLLLLFLIFLLLVLLLLLFFCCFLLLLLLLLLVVLLLLILLFLVLLLLILLSCSWAAPFGFLRESYAPLRPADRPLEDSSA